MALPNMAMIPSGYKPTKLYSVLPTPENGSELITNGDFSNGSTDWTIESNWTIAGGVANGNGANGTSQELTQGGLTSGKTYSITYEIKNYVSGVVKTRKPAGTFRSGNGVYAENLTASASGLTFQGGNFNGSITNISAKEVLVSDADFTVTRASSATRVNEQGLIETPEFIESGEFVTNGDFSNGSVGWFVGSQWTVANGAASLVGDGSNSSLSYPLTLIQFKTYKVTFDVLAISGRGKLQMQTGITNEYTTTGSKVFYVYIANNPNTSANFARKNGVVSMTITNISIVEVEREDIPRLDYTDGGCPVLLTEPQRTNNLLYSQELDNAWWLKSNVTITPNTSTSPDGALNAQTLTSIAINSVVYRTGIACGSLSFFAKDIDLSIGKFRISVDNVGVCLWNKDGTLYSVNGGTATNGVDYGNGWFRFAFNVTSGSVVNYGIGNGSGSESILVFGLQNEPSATYPTSYIPTNGTSVTRNQDIVNNAGTSATYNSTEGVLFAEVAALADDVTSRSICLSDNTSNNRILFRYEGSNLIRGFIVSSSTIQAAFSFTHNNINNLKFAIKWKINDFALWVNGVEVATDTSGNTPTGLKELALDNGGGGQIFFGKTSQVQVFNTALSDFDLLNLTSNATAYATYETMRTSLNFNIQ